MLKVKILWSEIKRELPLMRIIISLLREGILLTTTTTTTFLALNKLERITRNAQETLWCNNLANTAYKTQH
jgi:hypothetical protein